MATERSLSREEGLFVSGVNAALIDEPLPRAVWVLYLLAAVLVVAIALAGWSMQSRSSYRALYDSTRAAAARLRQGSKASSTDRPSHLRFALLICPRPRSML